MGLLFVYSMGLGIPFILAALAISFFMGFMVRFRKHLALVEKVMGLLLVISGVLFITGSLGYFGINSIGVWLLDLFPGLAELG
jgi:cytochrome c-type biogenesis protein